MYKSIMIKQTEMTAAKTSASLRFLNLILCIKLFIMGNLS